MTERLLRPDEVAQWMGTTTDRLAQARYKGTGPRFIKLGRSVFYAEAHLEEWVASNTHQRTV